MRRAREAKDPGEIVRDWSRECPVIFLLYFTSITSSKTRTLRERGRLPEASLMRAATIVVRRDACVVEERGRAVQRCSSNWNAENVRRITRHFTSLLLPRAGEVHGFARVPRLRAGRTRLGRAAPMKIDVSIYYTSHRQSLAFARFAPRIGPATFGKDIVALRRGRSFLLSQLAY